MVGLKAGQYEPVGLPTGMGKVCLSAHADALGVARVLPHRPWPRLGAAFIMTFNSTRSGRVTGPLSYQSAGGEILNIPLGPCLIERGEGQSINIIWGPSGQSLAVLALDKVKAAHDGGCLVLVD